MVTGSGWWRGVTLTPAAVRARGMVNGSGYRAGLKSGWWGDSGGVGGDGEGVGATAVGELDGGVVDRGG